MTTGTGPYRTKGELFDGRKWTRLEGPGFSQLYENAVDAKQRAWGMNTAYAEGHAHARREAEELLRRCEWYHDRDLDNHFCPWCDALREHGHAPDCELAKFLARNAEAR